MSSHSSNFNASPTSAPLQVTGQRMHGTRAGSASTQGVSPTGIASPPPFFASGAPASPMMLQHQGAQQPPQAQSLFQAPPSPGGYSSYPLSHPSSPVSRFNSQAPLSLSNVNLLAPAASCAIPSGLTSPNSQQQRIQQMIRPQASRSGGTAGLAGSAAFQHPLHSTAVQASHSLGQQKVSAGGAAASANNGSSGVRVGSAGNNSGSASPAAGAKAARLNKSGYDTFPRLNSAAAAGSASRSAGSPSNDHLMSSGASPVPLQGSAAAMRDRASPTMIGRSPEPSSATLQATGQSLHPRAATATGHRETVGNSGFGVKRGVNVTRTPPHSSKKRSNGYRRNSEHTAALASADPNNPDGELQHRLEDMDLADDGYTPTEAASGYSSDASTFSEASAFPSAALVDHTNYTAPYYTQVTADDEEELADVSGGGTGTGHLGSRFPPPSSPMQLRPGGIPPPPHRMMGGGLATPTPSANAAPSRGPPSINIGGSTSTAPPTPLRSYSRHIGDHPSSAESSAMQSPLMDGLLHSGSILPPHPSSSTAASRLGASAPFTFPMSPIPPIESGSVFDTSAVAALQASHQHHPLKTLLSASLTPLPPPTATLSGGLGGLILPSPAPLRLTTVPALNLPSPHALIDASALATSTSSSAASPRSATASGALSFDPTHKYQLQLAGLQGGADCSSAFSSARSLAHSTSGASLGAGSEQDPMTDFNSTARSLSGNTSSSMCSASASNASSSASLHQHLQPLQHAHAQQLQQQQLDAHQLDQHTRLSYHTQMQR